ncbi:hypothetical protein TNCV_2965531 [Trichonephila clavipes]|nr:hypothetical protein TNCV_2965531 [Trichonephila clavipes]
MVALSACIYRFAPCLNRFFPNIIYRRPAHTSPSPDTGLSFSNVLDRFVGKTNLKKFTGGCLLLPPEMFGERIWPDCAYGVGEDNQHNQYTNTLLSNDFGAMENCIEDYR